MTNWPGTWLPGGILPLHKELPYSLECLLYLLYIKTIVKIKFGQW